MVSRKEQMQRIWHQYDSRRDHKPSSMRQAAAWAVADGFLTLPEVDPIDILAERWLRLFERNTRLFTGTTVSCKPRCPRHQERRAILRFGA